MLKGVSDKAGVVEEWGSLWKYSDFVPVPAAMGGTTAEWQPRKQLRDMAPLCQAIGTVSQPSRCAGCTCPWVGQPTWSMGPGSRE